MSKEDKKVVKKTAVKQESLMKPTLVLTIICLVTTFALALTNFLTKDTIKKVKEEKANEQRQIILPSAKTFTEKTFKGEQGEFVYYEGKDASGNIVGFIFNNKTPGYGGDVIVNLAVNDAGEIQGVQPFDLQETPNIGMKVANQEFLDQFKGLVGEVDATSGKPAENEVQAVSGATISTSAFVNSVNLGMKNLEAVTGRKLGETVDPKMDAFPGATAFTAELKGEAEGEAFSYYEAFNEANEVVGYVFQNAGPGYHSGKNLGVFTGLDMEGKIVGTAVYENNETKGLGAKVEKEDFRTQFVGKNSELSISDIEGVSGATISSEAFLDQVNKAFVQFKALDGKISGQAPVVSEPGEATPEQIAYPGAASFSEEKSVKTDAGEFKYKEALDASGAVIGYLFSNEVKGYNSAQPFTVLVGIDKAGAIVGNTPINNKETKGLGSKIEKEDFTSQFVGKNAEVKMPGDINGITGATVSSEAYVEAVNQAIAQFSAVGGA